MNSAFLTCILGSISTMVGFKNTSSLNSLLRKVIGSSVEVGLSGLHCLHSPETLQIGKDSMLHDHYLAIQVDRRLLLFGGNNRIHSKSAANGLITFVGTGHLVVLVLQGKFRPDKYTCWQIDIILCAHASLIGVECGFLCFSLGPIELAVDKPAIFDPIFPSDDHHDEPAHEIHVHHIPPVSALPRDQRWPPTAYAGP